MIGAVDSAVQPAVIEVRDLRVDFDTEAGALNAVRGLDLDLRSGRTTALVGESGSGKSVSALAVLGLLPDAARVSGSVTLRGRELVGLPDRDFSAIRGSEIAMVFQDPLSSLTPVFTVGAQISEALRAHRQLSGKQAWARAVELLDLVGIPDPARRARSFPHELSGGMRQRVMIAMAIANDPAVIIADEPTTALDVTIQAQILEVLRTAQRETGAAMLLITHDLGVVAGTADDVVVMYAGRAVETADVEPIFVRPRMPYTIGLLGAVPRVDRRTDTLTPIPGAPPALIDLDDACPFAPRCPLAVDDCLRAEPELRPLVGGRRGCRGRHGSRAQRRLHPCRRDRSGRAARRNPGVRRTGVRHAGVRCAGPSRRRRSFVSNSSRGRTDGQGLSAHQRPASAPRRFGPRGRRHLLRCTTR